MRLLGCNQKCIETKDTTVCGLVAIGRLRLLGEADPLIGNAGDILYFDYLTPEEEDELYGANN